MTDIRRVGSLSDDELWALGRNTTIDPKTRHAVEAEMAERIQSLEEQQAEEAVETRKRPTPTSVKIIDVDIPFGSLVALQFKLVFAAVPVAIVVLIAYAIIRAVVTS